MTRRGLVGRLPPSIAVSMAPTASAARSWRPWSTERTASDTTPHVTSAAAPWPSSPPLESFDLELVVTEQVITTDRGSLHPA